MALLKNTEIKNIVRKYINGDIARVGGSVDQIIEYSKNTNITDINILDGGFGSIKNVFQSNGIKDFVEIILRKIKQEIKYLRFGDKIPLDRNTIQFDLHFVQNYENMYKKFDGSISSNMIEHSPNVIYLLLCFHYMTKNNGWMFHAIPNYEYTYDKYRIPTTLEHFIEDFENHVSFEDNTHNEDYIESAIVKDGWQKEFHKKYPVAYPFMHFHVFDYDNVKELFKYMFEEVTCDVIRNEQFGDNVVICKNKLNKDFLDKYSSLIEKVENGVYFNYAKC